MRIRPFNCFQLCSFGCFLVPSHCPKGHTIEAPALDSIPDKYTSTTDSAVLSNIGTAMM